MNDERCDRDRVTAILTLADELRPEVEATLANECPVWEERFDAGTGFVIGLSDAVTVAARFCARRLLEALDTIDRLEDRTQQLHGACAALEYENMILRVAKDGQ